MFRNYLKVALRTLMREKLYALINIGGLAIGLACCILIFLFVRRELSFDSFHQNADRLYRVITTEDLPDRDPFTYADSPPPLAEAMKRSFPGVREAVRLALRQDLVRIGDNSYRASFLLADPGFFRTFSFPLTQGSPETALSDLNGAVISETLARRLFGSKDPMHQPIAVKLADSFYDFEIVGIAAPPPENSSLTFDLVLPFENARKFASERTMTAWFNVWLETYVLLTERATPQAIDRNLRAVVDTNYPEDSRSMVTLHLQPLRKMHLQPEIPGGNFAPSNPLYSYILTGIGFLVLAIACINFMTLAIGRSASRALEVGVRKTLGAAHSQLLRQFWGESIILSVLALALGLLLAALALPKFNEIAGGGYSLKLDLTTLLALVALVLFVGAAAGSYPAVVLARLRPAVVIRRDLQVGGAGWLSRGLVLVQFAISIFLIIITFIMHDQLLFLRNKNLGFNREQIVVILNKSPEGESAALVERFRTALANDPRILGVTAASSNFGTNWTKMGYSAEDQTFKQFFQLTVDFDYLEVMGIKLIEGRNFRRDMRTDSSEAILVNEAFLHYFDLINPIGKSIPGPRFPPHRIIGVVQDFNFLSLQSAVQPLVLTLDPLTMLRGINDINSSNPPRGLNFIFVRIAGQEIPATIARIKERWARTATHQPFTFSFLDDDIQAQYRSEERWGTVMAYAAGFAILIACLGLFGLAALNVANRTREIGIRKVLGASVIDIVVMLVKEFGAVVLLANAAAWPLAFLASGRWLRDFAYRIGLTPENYLFAAILALAIALISISYQALRAAFANPVQAIKQE